MSIDNNEPAKNTGMTKIRSTNETDTACVNKTSQLIDNEAEKGLTKSSLVAPKSSAIIKEVNGPKGLEPTRYGDWEANGRCYDF